MFKFNNLKYFLPLLSILLLEVISSLIFTPNQLFEITKLLNEDPYLLWRHKSHYDSDFQGAHINLNDMGFRDTYEISTWNKSNIRILIMGASPSFGWGLENAQVYSTILAKKFSERNISASVINASQIGYSSHQGKMLLEKIVSTLKPTHIIFSYILNDLDYFRFFENKTFPDKNLLHSNEILISVKNILSSSRTYMLFQDIILKLQQQTQTQNYYSENVTSRVPLVDYENNFKALIETSRSYQAIPIILKMPVNLKEASSPEYSGMLLHKFTAKVWENSKIYQASLDKISKVMNTDLIDIVTAFENQNDYLFIDKRFDPIHPNAQGHEIIAQTVWKYFESKLSK